MRLFPDAMSGSAYDIDYGYLYDRGYRGIIFDIDNTLVEHNEPATDRAVRLVDSLHDMGYRVCVVSNNREPRVKSFADAAGCGYVFKAGKPGSGSHYRRCSFLRHPGRRQGRHPDLLV